MSIVHVVAAGEVGGAERMLVDLLRGSAARASVALLTPNDDLRKLFAEAGIDVDDRGPVREHPLAFLRGSDVAWLADLLRRRSARLVHLHTFASQVLGTRAAARVGARVVRTEHSTRVYDDLSCRPFARWSLERADRIVFISDHVRRTAFARMPFLKGRDTRVIHNGVDTEHFAVAPMPSSEADPAPATSSGVPAEAAPSPAPPPDRGKPRVRLVALGRLDPRKGLELAIAAVARVPRVVLEIVGAGDERARLEKLAAPLGARVVFRGYAADVRPAVARAHAILTSAREEGLGIALLEGMAMGRPVVGVPVGGIPEIVTADTGWLATARSVEALAAMIAQAAADHAELERRGAEARLRVEKEFSVDAMRAKYAQVYGELGI